MFSVKSKTGQGIGSIEHLYKMAELYHLLGWNALQVAPMNLCSMGMPYSLKSTRLMDWGYVSLDLLLGRSGYGEYDEFLQELKGAGANLSQVGAYFDSARVQAEINQLRNAKTADHLKVRNHIKAGLGFVWQAFRKLPASHPVYKGFSQYKQKNTWLSDHILFVLMEEKYATGYKWLTGWDFRSWYPELSKRRPEHLEKLKKQLQDTIDFYSFMQYVFWRQWQSFLKFSHQHNVGILGDMPWAADGADIWIYQNMFDAAKGTKRRYTQALPPDSLHHCGQYYQFNLYNWKNPGTLDYFLNRFKYLSQYYDYLRLDFARGAYRLYRFFEDPEDELVLEKLGIMKQDGSWYDEAFAARLKKAQQLDTNHPDSIRAQLEVAKEFYWIILKALYESKGLNSEDKIHFFNEYNKKISDGFKRGLTQDSTIYIARPAQINGNNFKADTHTNGWERTQYVVERGMTPWDLLPIRQGNTRITAGNQSFEARYEFDFLRKYLFPNDATRGPRPQDGLRVGYFVKSPGEKLISEVSRIAQESGKVVITELLGMMPEQKLNSIHSLAGIMNYAPGIFLDPVGNEWVKKKQIYRPWSMATYSTHDTINLEGGKATGAFKGMRDDGLKAIAAVKGKSAQELRMVTLSDAERHRLLDPVVATQSLLSILMWVDWGNWPGPWTERITNISGTNSGNWACKMPIFLEDLLDAARNQNAPAEAREIIGFLRNLPQRKVAEVKAVSEPVLVSAFPSFGIAKQQRFADKNEKFEVWAFVNIQPDKKVKVQLLTAGKAYDMQLSSVDHGLSPLISMYTVLVNAKEFNTGNNKFTIKINGKTQKGSGLLQATTSTKFELNRVKVPLRTQDVPVLASFASSTAGNPLLNELYGEFQKLKTLPHRAQVLEDFWGRVKRAGAPLIGESHREAVTEISKTPVVFLYRQGAEYKDPISAVALTGDMTGWWPRNNLPFIRLEGTNLWYLEQIFNSRARLDYRFVLNEHYLIPDPLNQRKSATKHREHYIDNSELAMPDFQRPHELDGEFSDTERLKKVTVPSPQYLKYSHDAWIYLPPKYNPSDKSKKYPAIYFQDGIDYLRLTNAAAILDNLINTKQIQPVVGIFVNPPQTVERNRMTEYIFNENYVRFFSEELVSYIENKILSGKIIQHPSKRLVLGYCSGGLISLYIALARPDIFGKIASQSAYISSNDRQLFAELPKLHKGHKQYKALSIYMSVGEYATKVRVNGHQREFNFLRDNDFFSRRLIKLGYNVGYRELHDGHSWGCWRNELPDILRHFFTPTSRLRNQAKSSSSVSLSLVKPVNRWAIKINGVQERGRFVWPSVALKTLSLRRFFLQKSGLLLKQPIRDGFLSSSSSYNMTARSKESAEKNGKPLQAIQQKSLSQRFFSPSQGKAVGFLKSAGSSSSGISSGSRPIIIFAKNVNAYLNGANVQRAVDISNRLISAALRKPRYAGNRGRNKHTTWRRMYGLKTQSKSVSSSVVPASFDGNFMDPVWRNLRGRSLYTVSSLLRPHVKLLDKTQLRSIELSMAFTKMIFPADYKIIFPFIAQGKIQVVTSVDMGRLLSGVESLNVLTKDTDRSNLETRAITFTQEDSRKRNYVVIIGEKEFLSPADLLADMFHEIIGHIARYENPNAQKVWTATRDLIEFSAYYREKIGLEETLNVGVQLIEAASQTRRFGGGDRLWFRLVLHQDQLKRLIDNAEEMRQCYFRRIQKTTEFGSSSSAQWPRVLRFGLSLKNPRVSNNFFDKDTNINFRLLRINMTGKVQIFLSVTQNQSEPQELTLVEGENPQFIGDNVWLRFAEYDSKSRVAKLHSIVINTGVSYPSDSNMPTASSSVQDFYQALERNGISADSHIPKLLQTTQDNLKSYFKQYGEKAFSEVLACGIHLADDKLAPCCVIQWASHLAQKFHFDINSFIEGLHHLETAALCLKQYHSLIYWQTMDFGCACLFEDAASLNQRELNMGLSPQAISDDYSLNIKRIDSLKTLDAGLDALIGLAQAWYNAFHELKLNKAQMHEFTSIYAQYLRAGVYTYFLYEIKHLDPKVMVTEATRLAMMRLEDKIADMAGAAAAIEQIASDKCGLADAALKKKSGQTGSSPDSIREIMYQLRHLRLQDRANFITWLKDHALFFGPSTIDDFYVRNIYDDRLWDNPVKVLRNWQNDHNFPVRRKFLEQIHLISAQDHWTAKTVEDFIQAYIRMKVSAQPLVWKPLQEAVWRWFTVIENSTSGNSFHGNRFKS
ncbi:MAG: 4-alpha-glucanotransferase, partial [Candidatus Omnitrophota bacterium]